MGSILHTAAEIPYGRHRQRKLQIYLPRNYKKRTGERFPVLYMHDGQNLFLNETSFAGISWGIRQAMEAAERRGYEGMIVVGIENAGRSRIPEYSAFPYAGSAHGRGEPAGEAYLDWIVTRLKPEIDRSLRTRPDRASTFLAGSSAGANISLYGAAAYPKVFSKTGLFSAALWLFREAELDKALDERMLGPQGRLRAPLDDSAFFIQCGTEEGGTNPKVSRAYLQSALWLDRALLQRGVRPERVALRIKHGLTHSEGAWRAVFPEFLNFLRTESK